MLKIINILTILGVLWLPYFSPLLSYASADFQITYDYVLEYKKEKDFVNVKDITTYSVKNDKYFLPAGIEQTFFLTDYSKSDIEKERAFKLKSLKITDQNDIALSYKKSFEKEGIKLMVKLPRQVTSFDDLTVKLSYTTHDLVNMSGNIVNMYVPALPKETPLNNTESFNLISEYKYNTQIITPIDFVLPSYTQPQNISYSQNNENRIYKIDVKDRIGKVSWLQFGNNQYYKFKIEQEAKKTDFLTPTQISNIAPVVSTNIYKIAIPREYEENNQKIFISKMSPTPKNIQRDSDGNLIATFEVPANTNNLITIEGLISLNQKSISEKEEIPNQNLADYVKELDNFPDLLTYTQSDKYWESTDPVVDKIAKDLLKKSSSIQELILNDYQYIVDKFSYSDEKLLNGNERLGAKAALSGSQAICMEYSDSMTALLRAQGIPARIAIGYGNDPHNSESKISNTEMLEQKIRHQWTQVWIPNYGWMSVDPTWGESNRTYIGSDLDHILWYTNSSSDQDITEVLFYSAEQESIGKYNVSIQALSSEKFAEESKNAKQLDIAFISLQSGDVPIDLYLKASLGGRVLVYLIPIIAAITISSIITSIIYFFKRRNKLNQNQ